MPTPYETAIGSWTRRSTFFWAATGATVGLANMWKFPFLAGENGGGLFVLMYLACLLLVTLPLMLTETALGRDARHGLVLAFDGLWRATNTSRHWVWAGRLSVIAGFLVLSFTAVIAAICLAYVFYGAFGLFVGATEAEIVRTLTGLVEDDSGYRVFMAWHVAFMVLVVTVSMQGVVGGLERAFRLVVPAFLLLLLGLLAYGFYFGELGAASHYMLDLRVEDLSWRSLELALTHAFYTLGLGMAVWVIFGAYMPAITPLKRSVLAVALMDTLIAIMAGLAIFSLVFRGGASDPVQGFELVFLALPASLADVPGGQFVATAAFVVILLVAWTSALALLEPAVGWFQEWIGAPRGWSAFLMGALAWFVGLGTLYSFNVWSDWAFAGGTFFRWVEWLASGLLIPSVSIAIAVFVGWRMGRPAALALIGRAPRLVAAIWFWVLRLVLPALILYIGAVYTVSSLRSLCSENGEVDWCIAVEASLPGEAPDAGEARSQDEPAIDSGPGEASEQAPEPKPELKLPAEAPPSAGGRGEDAQPDSELLYHSV